MCPVRIVIRARSWLARDASRWAGDSGRGANPRPPRRHIGTTPIEGIRPHRHTRVPVFFLYLTGAIPPSPVQAPLPAPFLRRDNRLSSPPQAKDEPSCPSSTGLPISIPT